MLAGLGARMGRGSPPVQQGVKKINHVSTLGYRNLSGIRLGSQEPGRKAERRKRTGQRDRGKDLAKRVKSRLYTGKGNRSEVRARIVLPVFYSVKKRAVCWTRRGGQRGGSLILLMQTYLQGKRSFATEITLPRSRKTEKNTGFSGTKGITPRSPMDAGGTKVAKIRTGHIG